MYKLLFLVSTALFAVNATSQVINNPESVEYDAANNRYLVSNRATPISIQSLVPGQAPTLFTSSVTSPAGLEILDGKLWVCDGGNIKSFDLTTGAMVEQIILGGTFLNGITSDGSTMLYISDFTAKKIYSLNTATLDYFEIVANTVSTPNGMWYDGDNNRVLFVNWGTSAPIKAIALSDNSVSTVVTTALGNCDGIARDAAGNYFVSAWSQGAVYKFDSNLANPVAVVTGLTQPADIFYNTLNDTLVVPQTSADIVTFHNFSTAMLEESGAEEPDFSLFPNPATTSFTISINTNFGSGGTIRVFTLGGQLVTEIKIVEEILQGNEININTTDLSEGTYMVELNGTHGSVQRLLQIRN
jgi:hypothetical protein